MRNILILKLKNFYILQNKLRKFYPNYLTGCAILIIISCFIDIYYVNKPPYFTLICSLIFILYIFIMEIKNYKNFFVAMRKIPNLITLSRLLLLFVIVIIINKQYAKYLIIICLLGDFLDGFLARKLHQTSNFGAKFDAETDAIFCLFCSFILNLYYKINLLIFIAGTARFIFLIITSLIAKTERNSERNNNAKYYAAIYFISLTLYIILPLKITYYLLIFGNVLVLYSFGLSYVIFFKNYK